MPAANAAHAPRWPPMTMAPIPAVAETVMSNEHARIQRARRSRCLLRSRSDDRLKRRRGRPAVAPPTVSELRAKAAAYRPYDCGPRSRATKMPAVKIPNNENPWPTKSCTLERKASKETMERNPTIKRIALGRKPRRDRRIRCAGARRPAPMALRLRRLPSLSTMSETPSASTYTEHGGVGGFVMRRTRRRGRCRRSVWRERGNPAPGGSLLEPDH